MSIRCGRYIDEQTFDYWNSAVSEDATLLGRELSVLDERLMGRVAEDRWAEIRAGFNEMDEQFGTENWDGEGAHPVDPRSRTFAGWFMKTLPRRYPLPEFMVDPDGEVNIEWFEDARAVFSVSVSPTGRLNFSGLFGYSTVYGTESFSGEVPRIILENLDRLYSER